MSTKRWKSEVSEADEVFATHTYRFIRHPIYTAACLFVVAGAGAHWSWTTAAFGGFLAGALVRMLCEENMVTARYPEYLAYAAKSWRMIPYVF